MTQRYDALIIGAGHNGLVCAFYLARAGLKVRLLERRDVVGGAAVTEEFHPGFRNSVASYTVSLLQPQVIADAILVHPVPWAGRRQVRQRRQAGHRDALAQPDRRQVDEQLVDQVGLQ